MRVSVIPLLLLLAGGCAKYEFDLTQPPDLATHIGRDKETVLKRDELEYRMLSVDNRLLMHVVNPTDDPIELLGPQSTAVDPAGQSHPFRSQTIAPHSFIKLVLPPLRPVYPAPGPVFGIGVGIHAYRDPYPYGPAFEDPIWDEPRYFGMVEDDTALYWGWGDEGEARIRLTYRRAREEFHHEFVFRRKKV